MEPGNLPGHFVDVCGGQFAIGLQRAEQLALRELAHFQGVFDNRAVTRDLRRFGTAGDRQHFQIQIIGQALVQTQLFAAEVPARFKAGEIEKAEVDRLFQLIGIGTGEQDPGDMGLDDLESVYGMRVEGRVLQGGDQGLAHRRSFRVGENSRASLWPLTGLTQTSGGSC